MGTSFCYLAIERPVYAALFARRIITVRFAQRVRRNITPIASRHAQKEIGFADFAKWLRFFRWYIRRCCLILLIFSGQHCAQRCRENSRHSRHHLAAIFSGQRTRRPSHAGSSFIEAFANSKHAKMFYMANWVSQSANAAVEISDDGSTNSIHLIQLFFSVVPEKKESEESFHSLRLKEHLESNCGPKRWLFKMCST